MDYTVLFVSVQLLWNNCKFLLTPTVVLHQVKGWWGWNLGVLFSPSVKGQFLTQCLSNIKWINDTWGTVQNPQVLFPAWLRVIQSFLWGLTEVPNSCITAQQVWLQQEGWRVSTPLSSQWLRPCLEGRRYWYDTPPPSLMNGTEGFPFRRGACPPGRWSHAHYSNSIFKQKEGTLCRSSGEKFWQSPSEEVFGLYKLDQKVTFSSIPHRFPVLALRF